ncbi:hypothetical protein A2115_02280 [Candidatus Woesebacteria bacterium GWA1_41_8]|uniref:Uncharacterized protein n=1 Tax=Candidatus Woesebacteria bacterium GWA1_41_8 TaxID=1802471 RepID=A0A1F7WKZ3_9BACT|nr:MAG: hypothetical protein A2115_02280 [Candidatus Woesebacteria bacterium GWA1_41_8]
MENSLKNILDQSNSVLVMLPTKPFFDQAAAGLSLYLTLRQSKEVQVFCPTPVTVELNRLIGINKITQEMGSKNLIIRFIDYKASDIERVSYDIEDGQFRLTVIPKQQINPPGKDQVDLAYSGVSADTVILIGGTNEQHFPALSLKELANSRIIHIGTKDISINPSKKVISLARPASSVSEVMTALLKESGLQIDGDIATDLLMGIESATNDFSDMNVTADTFAAVAELMRAGGRRNAGAGVSGGNFPPGSIPGTNTPAVQQNVQSQPMDQTNQANKTNDDENAPKDWLEPKIYKGTSV